MHRSLYAQQFLHRPFYPQMPLHRKQFTHRSFCTQHAFTHSQPLHGEALLPLLDHLPLVFPPSSFIMESLKTSTRPQASTVVAVVGSIVEVKALSMCLRMQASVTHTDGRELHDVACILPETITIVEMYFSTRNPVEQQHFSIGIQVCPIKACPQIHWFFIILPS